MYFKIGDFSQRRNLIAGMKTDREYPVLGREEVLGEILENFGLRQEAGKVCQPRSPSSRQRIQPVTQVSRYNIK